MDSEKIRVDFGARKTEAEWSATFDGIVLKGTEVWFRWLSWTLALGLLQYLNAKAKSAALELLIGLSTILFFFYFQGSSTGSTSTVFCGLRAIRSGGHHQLPCQAFWHMRHGSP